MTGDATHLPPETASETWGNGDPGRPHETDEAPTLMKVGDHNGHEEHHPRPDRKTALQKAASTQKQQGVDESFLHRVTPVFKLLRLYSRLEVTGLENVGEGPAILAANHTGWLGLDYAYTALSVYDAKKRIVRGMAHSTWFKREQIGQIATRLGLFEANRETLREILDDGELVLMFPEGEKGAFKPKQAQYELQTFARGWVQVALETGVPIIPVAIVGGEEANPSSGQIDSYERLLDLSLPMPQNLFPRPVKWRISLLEPFVLEGGKEAARDRAKVEEHTEQIRGIIQKELRRLLSLRGHPYL